MKNFFYLFVLIFVLNKIIAAQPATDTIQVSNGWNLIGALTTGNIPSIVNTVPPGIIISSFWGFNPASGYFQEDSLKRGYGYWVKVNQAGKIILGISTPFVCGISQVYYSGKNYNTVQIGSQCWLKENLDVGVMISGSQYQTNNGVIEKYCYGNDPSSCSAFGGFYTWNEAMQYSTVSGTKGICPPGWHLPTQDDFFNLAILASFNSNTLKALGQGSGSGIGTNTTDFSALLVGFFYTGQFFDFANSTAFWSSTQFNTSDAYELTLYATNTTLSYTTHGSKDFGISIRCLKD